MTLYCNSCSDCAVAVVMFGHLSLNLLTYLLTNARRWCTNENGYRVFFYQTERSQDGKAFNSGESQFDETQDNYDDVEAVPAILQVRIESKRQHFQHRFSREDSRKHLQHTQVRMHYRSGTDGRCCIGARQTLHFHSPGGSCFLHEMTSRSLSWK